MKYNPKRVHILENGQYMEITNEDHEYRKATDAAYAERYFFPIHGDLLEVKREDYEELYRAKERMRYIKRKEIENGTLSLDAFDSEDDNGIDFIPSDDEDVAESVARQDEHAYIRHMVELLPQDERYLIEEHFYKNVSQIELAERLGVDQSTISRRITKICAKLKIFLEN